LIVRVSF
jgi:hypothetical protein